MEDPITATFLINIFFAFTILCGNSLVIYLYFADTVLRCKISNKFVISLAFCDSLAALVFIPCKELFRNAIESEIRIPIAGYASSLSVIGSLLNLAALTFDRYIAIFNGLRYEAIMTSARVTKMMIAIWLFDFVVTLLPLTWKFVTTVEVNSLCLHVYQIILMVAIISCHLILLVVYAKIFMVTRRHLKFARVQTRRFTNSSSSNGSSLDKIDGRAEMGFANEITTSESSTPNDEATKIHEKQRNSNSDVNASRAVEGAAASNDINECQTNPNSFEETGKISPKRLPVNRTTLKRKAGEALDRFKNSRAMSVEMRAAKIVLLLFIFNTVCWLPTVTLNIVYLISWLKKTPSIPPTLMQISTYSYLLYSAVNPWLYGLLKEDFKNALTKHVLKKLKRFRANHLCRRR
eukprot:Seg2529.4 transcript_id=Seg2529.4/GoldUCD/mRNA.D3Y31 product="alpha-2C adrenergic receptor" protein_id=Seg2529.4/GoldUCD/D3Y31